MQSTVDEKKEDRNIGYTQRLKRVPSLDVQREQLYAGTMPVDSERARQLLTEMGFRSDLAAYVYTLNGEPDDGAFVKNSITEGPRRVDVPQVYGFVSPLNRVKSQLSIRLFSDGDETDVLAHRTAYPVGQPTRSASISEEEARDGVRDFRQVINEELGKTLPGAGETGWEVNV
jgi:hypothetical protein